MRSCVEPLSSGPVNGLVIPPKTAHDAMAEAGALCAHLRAHSNQTSVFGGDRSAVQGHVPRGAREVGKSKRGGPCKPRETDAALRPKNEASPHAYSTDAGG